nr:DUF2809 domain-containing protein [uncultured Mucilaginibacter sp.]
MRFNRIYFILATTLFFIEVIIALYVHDAFIRPYFGDVLVVILLYCAVRSVANTPVITTAITVFFIACLIELSQYFHLVQLLGWGSSKTAATVLGTSFSFTDVLMYALGILTVIGVETYFKNLNTYTIKTNENPR